MKKTLAVIAASTVVVFLLATGCVYNWDSQEQDSPEQASQEKWVDLFDGETLNGWV